MKSVKGRLDAALAKPDPSIRFYLFHGADDSGSRAAALRLLKGLGDAEKFIVMGQSIKLDPASLTDEAGAMALFGGPRAIWIEPASDEIADGVQALLESSASESAVVALAGVLKKSSSLLKLAEAHPAALSHISYVPEARDMERIVVELGRAAGLNFSNDIAQRIAVAANNNQAVAATELDKFAIFLGAGVGRTRELGHDTLDLLGADSAEGDWIKLGDLALAGRIDLLTDELARLPGGGSEAIPIIRALQRRLMMLAPLRARIERGERVDGVLTSLGKALFWKDKDSVQRMLGNWSSERLAEAASRVGRLERQLMFSKPPERAALGESLIELARAASRAR